MRAMPSAWLSAGSAQVSARGLALAVHALSSTRAGARRADKASMAVSTADVATQLSSATLLAARQVLALTTRL